MDDYRSYRGAIVGCIQALRPHVEVATIGLDALEEQVARFDPHLVISNLSVNAVSGERLAWVALSMDPLLPSAFWIRGRYWEQRNPALDSLIAAIDELEELVKNDDPEGHQIMYTEQTEYRSSPHDHPSSNPTSK